MSFNKDNAIIGQNAATAASNIVASLVSAGAITPADVTSKFDELRQHIFQGSIEIAGAETVVRSFESAPVPTAVADAFPETTPTPAPVASAGGSVRPNGDMELKFGKYRGKTLDQVWAIPNLDRSGIPEGQSWLQWAAENTNNDFAKSKIREYMAAA